MLSCNHDCFNCPYPDVPDECLSAPLTYDEYKESRRIDSESRYEQKTNAQKKVYAQNKSYREANKEKLADKQSCIRTVRRSHNMSQHDLARLVGVHHTTISGWECGTSPANWDKLCAVLPELEEYRP